MEFWLDDKSAYGDVKRALLDKLAQNKTFYKGIKSPVFIYGRSFTDAQKREFASVLLQEFGMKELRFVEEETAPSVTAPMQTAPEQPLTREQAFENQTKTSLFVRHTVRSGQRLEAKGDIVVVGDVNAGAELVAGGSIAVFGKLRGLAHAGAEGDRKACIVANVLIPQQLRIAEKIILIPANREIEGAEMVSIQNGEIIVELVN